MCHMNKNEIELELVCINEQYFGDRKAELALLKKYRNLQRRFRGDSRVTMAIHDPEMWEEEKLYKEASVFIHNGKENFIDVITILLENGIEIDQVHFYQAETFEDDRDGKLDECSFDDYMKEFYPEYDIDEHRIIKSRACEVKKL